MGGNKGHGRWKCGVCGMKYESVYEVMECERSHDTTSVVNSDNGECYVFEGGVSDE